MASPSMRVRAVVAAAFLTLQVIVPTWQLFAPRPARFGWQMFSAHTTAPAFAIERVDGERRRVDVDDYFAFRRGDLDPAVFERLPAHMCRLDASIAAVYEQRDPAGPIETHRCR